MKRRFLATIPLVLIMLVAMAYATDSTDSLKPTSHPEAVHASCSTSLYITFSILESICGVAFVPRITGRAHVTINVAVGSVSSAAVTAVVVIIKSTSGIPSLGSAIPPGDTIMGPFQEASLPASPPTGYFVTIPDDALDTSLTVGTTVYFYIAVAQINGVPFDVFGPPCCGTEITVIEP